MADPAPQALGRGHEPDRPHLQSLVLAALAILGVIVIGMTAAYTLVAVLAPTRSALQPPRLVAGAPALQVSPERDRIAFDQEKQRSLHEYAWVDRKQGIVRIPIERAMALLLQRQRKGAQ